MSLSRGSHVSGCNKTPFLHCPLLPPALYSRKRLYLVLSPHIARSFLASHHFHLRARARALRLAVTLSSVSLARILSRSSLLILVFPFLSFISTAVKRELLAPVKVNRVLNDVDCTRTRSTHAVKLHLNYPDTAVATELSLWRAFCGNYNKRGFVRRACRAE